MRTSRSIPDYNESIDPINAERGFMRYQKYKIPESYTPRKAQATPTDRPPNPLLSAFPWSTGRVSRPVGDPTGNAPSNFGGARSIDGKLYVNPNQSIDPMI